MLSSNSSLSDTQLDVQVLSAHVRKRGVVRGRKEFSQNQVSENLSRGTLTRLKPTGIYRLTSWVQEFDYSLFKQTVKITSIKNF